MDFQVRTLKPNLTIVALQIWAYKNAKIANVWYKLFAPKGYVPLGDFYQIWRGEADPMSPHSRKLLPLSH